MCGRGINYMLNIGPQPDGRLPAESVETLKEVAGWMSVCGESIHGTEASPFPSDLPSGPVTRKGNALYLHLRRGGRDTLSIPGLMSGVRCVQMMGGPDLAFERAGDTVIIDLGGAGNGGMSVVKVICDEPLNVDPLPSQDEDGVIALLPHLAEISEGEGASEVRTARRIGAAGEVVSYEAPRVSPGGVISGWHDTNYIARWSFRLGRPGAYRVRIETGTNYHSQPWEGGQVVEVQCGGETIRATLRGETPSRALEDRYYPRAVSDIGCVTFGESGRYELALKAIKISDSQENGLAVSRILIEPVPAA